MIRKIRKTRRNENRSRRFESRGVRRRFNESEESNVLYTAQDADFYSEEDSYEEGVIGKGYSWNVGLNLQANTLEELFSKIKRELYMDGEGFYWSVQLSDMNGWTSFEVEYEGNDDGDLASEREIEDWKNGDERLWLVRGSVIVKKTVKPSNVPDEEMESFARAKGLEIQ